MLRSLFILCLFTSNFYWAQVTLSTSLTACYALNGNTNDPINSFNGTLSAVTATVDRFSTPGNAMRFNGSSTSIIELPDVPLLKPINAFSFSAWIKSDFLPNGTAYQVFTKNTGISNFEAYALITFSSGGLQKFRGVKGNNGMVNSVTSITTVSLNTWYHVVFTCDNSQLNLYVNGTLENTVTTALSFNYQTGKKIYLGGTNESSYPGPFTGSLDNVRFYDRVLTGAEVSQLFLQDPSCVTVPAGVAPTAAFSVSSVSLCAGGTVMLTDFSLNSPTTWNWQIPGANPTSSSAQNPSIGFPNPGTYIVSLVSSNTVGASNTATQSIVVLPNPTLTVLANSPSICVGQNTNLFASGASSYTWSNFQQGPSINVAPFVNTSFSVTGVDNNGCANAGIVSVAVNPLPTVTAIASKSVICRGQNVTFTAGGAATYTWNSLQTTTTIVVSPFVNTAYVVTGTDLNGCKNSATISVAVSDCTGLTDNDLQNGFSVFPNPGNGVYEIKFSENKSGEAQVFNSLSELIYSRTFDLVDQVKFDISEFSNGIYLLKVVFSDQTIYKKIVKQ